MVVRHVALAFVIAVGSVAHAARPTIVLVRSGDPSPVVADAERRIGAELAVEGYAVHVIDRVQGEPTEPKIASLARELGADGALVLGEAHATGDGTTLELASLDVTDGIWQRREVVVEDSADGGAVLAIRAVELLHAHFLLRRIAARASAPEPVMPPVALSASSPARPPVRQGLALELAGETHADPHGGGAALAPAFRIAWLAERWGLRLGVTPGSSAFRFAAVEGDARATTRTLVADGLVLGRPGKLRLHAALGAALVRVEADGRATAPFRGISSTTTTGGARAAGGITWWAATRVGLTLELGALVTASPIVVLIAGTEQRTLGQPLLFATLGVILSTEPTR